MTESYYLLFRKIKRKLFAQIWVTRILALLLVLSLLGIIGSFIYSPLKGLFAQVWEGPKIVTTFFTDPLYVLPSYNGVTNVVIVGIGGGDHEGSDLTDSIIFASLDLKNNKVSLLSIPRDIWVPSLSAKINSAYYYGKQKSEEAGYTLLSDAVYEIVNRPIHYIVKIDFNGFVELIDTLGGVDVTVDKAFIDTQYPIAGKENDLCGGDPLYSCRYENLEFKTGFQHMDGATALKFSRSRHAEGDEGSDFARSLRQQKVIEALKSQLASKDVFLNPSKWLELKSVLNKYAVFSKPITNEEYAAFASFGVNFWKESKPVKRIVLDEGGEGREGFLMSPPLGKYGQWVLEPKGGNWKAFQEYFNKEMGGE